jgi:hypothetical protein
LQDQIYLGLTTTEALFSRSQLKKAKADKDNQSSGKHLQYWQGGMYAEKTAVMPLKDKCRATMLDAATALISAAVPKPIDITAIGPAILIPIC